MNEEFSEQHGLYLPRSCHLPKGVRQGEAVTPPEGSQLTRRGFLKAMGAAAATTLPGMSWADDALAAQQSQQSDFWDKPRELWLYRYATKEQIRATYFKDNELVQDEYNRLCWFMRDSHQNKMVGMDFVLLDVLRGIQGFYQMNGWNYPIVLNSGYRSPATNNKLESAAKNSMHLYGRAADIYMPGAPVRDVARLGLHFRKGGVGFYESKGFVHIDSGSLRTWRG